MDHRDIYHFQIGSIPATVFVSAREPLTRNFVPTIFTQDAERMVTAWDRLIAPEEFCQNILYLETGGKRVNPYAPDDFKYKLTARELT